MKRIPFCGKMLSMAKRFILYNLKLLLEDMRRHSWIIAAFPFSFNKGRYIVLVEDSNSLDTSDVSDLAVLTFVDERDTDRTLESVARWYGLSFNGGARAFREFFHIAYSNNLGDIIRQFTDYFKGFIPTKWAPLSKAAAELVVKRLDNRDRNESDFIYCYKLNRSSSGKQMYRSDRNDNKTRILRPRLYEHVGKDRTISFCYSDDPLKEASDGELLKSISLRS